MSLNPRHRKLNIAKTPFEAQLLGLKVAIFGNFQGNVLAKRHFPQVGYSLHGGGRGFLRRKMQIKWPLAPQFASQ